jgi:hypothetical protein
MPNITQIPFPGSSGNMPTGAMQFQGDWPGLFIRGDAAFRLQSELQELLALARQQEKRPRAWMEVERILEIIEHDVNTDKNPKGAK